MELLLNENWANGQFICSEEVYFHVGDRNQQITAKQNYEFLLRASLQYPIKAIGAPAAPLSVPVFFMEQLPHRLLHSRKIPERTCCRRVFPSGDKKPSGNGFTISRAGKRRLFP